MSIATERRAFIRWLIRKDLAEVQAIEELCFEYPWPESEFISRMRSEIGLTALFNEMTVGFAFYELHKTHFHLTSLAVMPAFQGRGVGRALVSKLIGKLDERRRRRIIADVRETNLDAQLFFQRLGFRAYGILPEHYENGEDAYCFEYRL